MLTVQIQTFSTLCGAAFMTVICRYTHTYTAAKAQLSSLAEEDHLLDLKSKNIFRM